MEAGHDFRAEVVCTLPPEHDADAITSDGHAVSFWQASDGSTTFARDGQAPHPPFDGIGQLRDGSPAIFPSPDGAHVAYVAFRSGRPFVGRDAAEDPPIPGFSRSVPPVFSHDGHHLAYGRLDGDDARLIVDGEPTGGRLAPIEAVFSPDGERLAYVEIRGERRSEVDIRIVLDGHAGEWMSGIRNAGGVMQFSPDSRHFAYCRGQDDLRKVQWVVDDVPQRAYDEVRSVGIAQLAPDGEHPAWIGRFGAELRPVLGDVVGPAFEAPVAVGSPWDGRPTWYFQSYGEVIRVTA
jgi:hypothetical protein